VRYYLALLLLAVPSLALAKPWRAVLSPGEVSSKHQAVEADCEKCHLAYKGVPNEKCLACHVGIDARSRAGEGFHFTVASQPCISCHGDHTGRDGALTKTAALKAFDHAKTLFPLAGPHAAVAQQCNKCHAKPLEALSPACGNCHEDTHKGSLGTRCQSCHAVSAPDWKAGLKTRAEHKTGLEGGHAKLGCNDCHKNGQHLKEAVACKGCHDTAHGGTKSNCAVCHQIEGWKPAKFEHSECACKFPGKHITFSCEGCHPKWKFTDTPTLCSGCHLKDLKHERNGECSLCHSALSWKRRDVFDHNKRSKFALTGEHLEVDCSRCHKVAGQWKGAPKDCKSCHASEGMTAHGDFGDCAKCHDTSGFSKSTFDHATTGFPLTGKHGKANCQSCHAEKVKGYRPAKTTFLFGASVWLASSDAPHVASPAAPGTCKHCHSDPHPGGSKEECSSCHATEVWLPSTFGLDRHTSFPIAGKHQKLSCNSCHIGKQLAGIPKDCGSCHLDVHAARFGKACADCHTEKSWKEVPSFDHARTGFSLSGVHAPLDCDSCHDGARGDQMAAAEKPSECRTCHMPGHGDLGPDCQKCHTDQLVEGHAVPFAGARALLNFNHRSTGFPLERRHAALACKQCHMPGTPRPASTCVSCHLDPHSGQAGATCEDCHRPDRFRLARFDHDRAGWPLRGKHFVTPCMSCHTNQRWVGLTTECYDCHAKDAARAKAIVPGIHTFGAGMQECRSCHRSQWTWRI